MVSGKRLVDALDRFDNQTVVPALETQTYAARFIPLLALERAALRRQLDSATLYSAPVLPCPEIGLGFYTLEARSIREGWPPVNIGDPVLLRQLRPEFQAAQGLTLEVSKSSYLLDGFADLMLSEESRAWFATMLHLLYMR